MKTKLTKNTNGFTLLELLVVLVIIGLLVSFVAPNYFGQLGKSEAKIAQAQIRAIEDALDQFRLDVGRYPSSEEGLNSLMVAPANAKSWRGPYLKKSIPLDPWGASYQYQSPGIRGAYDLFSQGSDSKIGGTGDAADIGNW